MNHFVFEAKPGWGFISLKHDTVYRLFLPFSLKREILQVMDQEGIVSSQSDSSVASSVIDQIDRYFNGQEVDLSRIDICLDDVPPFHVKVYQALRSIDQGKTTSYAELAKMAGSPKAARAVGQAMSRNRIPLIIPCHRVLSSDNKLTGFTAPGGLTTKEWLLNHEQANS